MKKLLFLILCSPFFIWAQGTDISKFKMEQNAIDSLFSIGQTETAIERAREWQQNADTFGVLPKLQATSDFAWYLENASRQCFTTQQYDKSLAYSQELLNHIRKTEKKMCNDRYKQEKYFAIRDIMISYFGLGEYDKALTQKKELYSAHKKGLLPCDYELCHYFNFDFFKIDSLNVWGYEWYDDLPKNRYSQSFTKIVYYVYSTNSDGTDKDQLYRLHVLMFHGDNPNFDYIMDKHISTDKGEWSGSMYRYTYKEDIDYRKLHNDVVEIVKGNVQPDTQRFIQSR